MTTYSHAPRPTGQTIAYTLKEDCLIIDSGSKVQMAQLGAVERIRLSYEPGRFSNRIFRARLTLKDGKSINITSVNWKSLIQAENLDAAYRTFVLDLIAAVYRTNPKVELLSGKPTFVWLLTVSIAVASFGGMSVLIWRALQMGSVSTALMGILLAVVGIWQIEPMVRLNKPRNFTADDPSQMLLP
ncbi:hypothetical protein JKG68_11760 [Microvirga aerilata]|uniref:Uncharacterized protein n=1 Tax=Microvirga aerilata TaxID=670292 RepID=A0A936ZF43_9HYPH|nr:hypothetical protein [Microvirga aerilata]MBL0404645.1 hypothetical protein [Microvirga aerilata]